jgi:hypothetical protein
MDDHPTLFTDEREAEIEAYGRLVAMREVLNGDGDVLFESDLPTARA